MHAPSAAHTYTHIHTAFDTHIHTAFDREDSAHSKRNPPRSTRDPGTYSLPRQTAGQRRKVSCVRCQRVLRSKPRVSVHASVCQVHASAAQTPRQTRTQTQSKTLMPTQTHNTRAHTDVCVCVRARAHTHTHTHGRESREGERETDTHIHKMNKRTCSHATQVLACKLNRPQKEKGPHGHSRCRANG